MNEFDRSMHKLLLLLLAIVGAVIAQQTTTTTTGKPKPVGFECDFEKDTCGWKQTSDSNVDWSRLIAGTGYGPDIDHTFGNGSGHYMYFDEIYDYDEDDYDWHWANDEKAKLISPRIDGSQKQCLKFYYHMQGSSVGILGVYFNIDKGSNNFVQADQPIWEKSTPQGDNWQLALVDYDGYNSSVANFIIEAHTGKTYLFGDISLDDIMYEYGACLSAEQVSTTCNFEYEHICGYSNDATAEFNWERKTGSTGSVGTGPQGDVTTGTGNGHYMFIEASSPQKQGDKARLLSPVQRVLGFNDDNCLYFYYHAYGPDVGELNVYSIKDSELQAANNSQAKNLLWTVDKNLGDQWYIANVPTSYSYDYRVIFEGVVGKSYQGDVAIDDVLLSARTCPVAGNCDFENGDFELCTYMNKNDADFDWELYSSTLASQFDGPLVFDHTLNNDMGRFMVANSPRKDEVGTVFSEKLDPTSVVGNCLNFYYYFSGSSSYNLTISIIDSNNNTKTLWSLRDNQIVSARWLSGKFKYYSEVDHRIHFTAVSGSNYKNFIGVDDIEILSGDRSCNGAPLVAIVQEDMPPSTVAPPTTTPQPTIHEYDCDFEGPCNWQNSPDNKEFTWKVVAAAGEPGGDPNAPGKDHTYQESAKGSFLGVKTSNVTAKTKAKFISPFFNSSISTYKCIEFYYYLYGSEVGTISLARKMNASYSSPEFTIWSRNSATNPSWQLAQVRAGYGFSTRTIYDIRIVFEMTASQYNGYAAVDDILVHDGECPPVDFCSFEDDLCGYVNDASGDFIWSRGNSTQGSTSTTGPSADHTSGTTDGYFMYINAGAQLRDQKARLLSPAQPKTAGSCIHFYFNMNGNNVGTLNLYALKANEGVSDPLVSYSTNLGDIWWVSQHSVKSAVNWTAIFEGVRGSGPNGNIAIDDIRISKGECRTTASCDFEGNNMCEYQNAASNEINWIIQDLTSGSGVNGPSLDHSVGLYYRGHYAVFNTEVGAKNATGRLESEIIQGGSYPTCFKFYYNMYSYYPRKIGQLNVYVKSALGNEDNLIWSLSGNVSPKKDEWSEGRFSIAESGQYQIIFEGVKEDDKANIAIDDLDLFQSTFCTVEPTEAGSIIPTVPPMTTTMPVPTNTYSWVSNTPFDCNFEDDLCTWSVDPSADGVWKRGQGSYSMFTGPKEDHTYGNSSGYFVYAYGLDSNKQYRLESQDIMYNDYKDYCVEFYYYLNGLNPASLNVYLKQNGELGLPVWSKDRNQINGWLRGEFKVRNVKYETFRVNFEAINQPYAFGTAALDDIRILKECGSYDDRFCDFESGTCGFTSFGDFQWKLTSNVTTSKETIVDHTTGTDSGQYMQASDVTKAFAQIGVINSRVIVPNSRDQCLEFFYRRETINRVSNLNVYTWINQSQFDIPVWSESTLSNGIPGWQMVRIPLGYSYTYLPYQVIIEESVSAGVGESFNVFLDDVFVRDEACLPMGDCDFEDGLCTWSIDRALSNINWQIDSADEQNIYRPSNDKTLGNSLGSYIYIESKQSTDKGNVAYLTSSVFQYSTGPYGRCLTFWYYISGYDAGFLTFRAKDLKTGSTYDLWHLGGASQGDHWNYGTFGFYSENPYLIQIIGFNGGLPGSVAIDDLIFQDSKYCEVFPFTAIAGPGLPKPIVTTTPNPISDGSDYDCTFEKDYCNWSNDTTKQLFWLRANGKTDTIETGPSVDHTLGTSAGYFAHIEASYPAQKNDAARMFSLPYTFNKANCFSFWYHMYGRDVGTLSMFIRWTDGSEVKMWSESYDQGDRWFKASVSLDVDQKYIMILEATRGSSYQGDIAIDDLEFREGNCDHNPNVIFECNFDGTDPLCGFENDATQRMNFTRAKGRVPNNRPGTGPDFDHTTGGSLGHYLALISQSFYPAGTTARVVSPQFPVTSAGYCLRWYFHMWGVLDRGELSIRVLSKKGEELQVWRFAENVGNFWSAGQATIRLPNSYDNFRVVLQGKPGQSYDFTPAFDDISLEDGVCPSYGSCDFENGYCTWQNAPGADFEWELKNGVTPTTNTGPQFDHTTGDSSGTFLFIEASNPAKTGYRAWLESSLFPPTPSFGLCFEFWYHMYGKDMGTLNLYANATDSNHTTILWSQSGDKGDQWRYGRINIKSQTSFRMLIEGVRGDGFYSDIALDDLEFIERQCSMEPYDAEPDPSIIITTPQPVTTRTFKPLTSYDCTFERDMCLWNTTGDFNWTRVQGTQGSVLQGPIDADHTLGTADGWYMSANLANRKLTDAAILQTNDDYWYGVKCMQFYYFLYTNSKFKFTVYTKKRGLASYPVFTRTDSFQADLWRSGQVTVGSLGIYQVLIEIKNVMNGANTDLVGIDDIYFTSGECQDSSDIDKLCTFSNGDMCGYQLSSSNLQFDWKVYNPSAVQDPVKDRPLPINDHTSEAYSSGYVYAQTSGMLAGATATLASKFYDPATTRADTNFRCLEFYYFLDVDEAVGLNNTPALSVYSKTSLTTNIKYPLWSRKHDHGKFWWKGNVNIALATKYNINFEAMVGAKAGYGLIALDDISLRNGPCSALQDTCDFENNDLCNWRNLNTSDFNWLLNQGPTPSSSGTGPYQDHTLGTYKGHYIFIEASSPAVQGWKAQLASEPMLASKPGCVDFWYHMRGYDMGSLNVYLVTDDARSLLWTLSGINQNMWVNGLAPFQSNKAHTIVIEGVRGNGYYSDIALDDLRITRNGNCQIQPVNAHPQDIAPKLIDCDFDDGKFCNWKNQEDSDLMWTLNVNPNDTTHRIKAEGALYSKRFIYLEDNSNFLSKGLKRRITSMPIAAPLERGYCLSFYYHMFGANAGNLTSYIINPVTNKEFTAFFRAGSQADKWIPASITIDAASLTHDFQIAFEATYSPDVKGVIALDQISISGKCPTPKYCDFESGTCGWTNDTSADFQWTRSNGATDSLNTGPQTDHTTLGQLGYYMYIETSSPRRTGDKARLMSPTYSATSGSGDCFKFWYHLYGSSIGGLNVWLSQGNILTKNVWSRKGDFGNQWRYGHVTVKSSTDFKIAMEGVVGTSYTGDAAIDDIEIENGECPAELSCDFEQDQCGFYNINEDDDFDWERSSRVYNGLFVDHTTSSNEGSYMFINPDEPFYGPKPGDKAWLVSEIIETPNSGCLKWWMFFKGKDFGNFTIYQRDAKGAKVQLYRTVGQGNNYWVPGQLTLARNPADYDLVFEATVGATTNNQMGLDDLVFTRDLTCEYLNSTTPAPITTPTVPATYKELSCTFDEGNLCGWIADPATDSQWTRQNSEGTLFGQAPLNDKTLQSAQGYYAYLNLKSTKRLDTAVLKSSRLPAYNQDFCFEFWYQLNAPAKTGLNLSIRDNTNFTVLWSRKGNMADTWTHAYVKVPKVTDNIDKYIEFDGDISYSYDGYLAIDDVTVLVGKCPAHNFCDFEEDMCNYAHDVTGDFKWTRSKGNTASFETGPAFDHTYQTDEGYYMYIETSYPQSAGQKARLISEKINRKSNGVCLQFWYHKYGTSIGSLSVYRRVNSVLEANPLWTLSGNQGNRWRQGAVTVNANQDFQVVFEGVVGSGYNGDIAIDDIFIDQTKACPPPGYCDFSDSLCLWHQRADSDFEYSRITAQLLDTIPNVLKPTAQADTTTNTKYGHFLWAPKGSNGTNNLVSETFFQSDYSTGLCFSFMAYYHGASPFDSLSVYRRYNKNVSRELIYNMPKVDSYAGDWHRKLVQLPGASSNFEIELEVKITTGVANQGNLFLDDFEVKSDCTDFPTTPDPSSLFNCGDGTTVLESQTCDFFVDCANGMDEKVCGNADFEKSQGAWIDESQGDLKWSRVRADQSVGGPQYDHTLYSPLGYYMYVDSSDTWMDDPGWMDAVLELDREIKPCPSECEIEFYYHMHGDDGELKVYLEETQSDLWDIYTKLWEVSGDQGYYWNKGTVRLGRISKNFKYSFDAYRDLTDDKDIAIDDIRFKNCQFPKPTNASCPVDHLRCANTACVPSSRWCDLTNDCGDDSDEQNCAQYAQCDFETGLCDWKPLDNSSSSLKWALETGSTVSFNTGPSRDHTTGTKEGTYIYLETSNHAEGTKAQLESPVILANSTNCNFRFFYHMYGKNIGALRVYSKTVNGLNELFSKTHEVGDYWERANIAVSESLPYQIVLEGTVGSGVYGDIGIDDTSFTDGCNFDKSAGSIVTQSTPSPTSPYQPCPLGQFQCNKFEHHAGLVCISENLVCDFKYDCDDKSDEAECGTCDFETGTCGWYDESDGEIDWVRKQAPSPHLTGPTVDHTTNSTGYYMRTDTDFGSGSFYDDAILLGPRLQATGPNCKITFWVHMGSQEKQQLQVFYNNFSNYLDYHFLKTISGPLGKGWVQMEVPIGEFPANYHVEFMGDPWDADYYEIGLDDIEMVNCYAGSQTTDLSLNCDFEKDFCNYYQDTKAEFEWERGYNHSNYRGPDFDHTTGFGYYAYIDNTWPLKRDDKARLSSSIQTSVNSPQCFSFWYHMFGPKIDTMNLYLDTFDDASVTDVFTRTLVWTRLGPKGNKWFEQNYNVNSSKPWRITVEGVIRDTGVGDMAIDDLALFQGECPLNRVCDFEADFCDYEPWQNKAWSRGQPTVSSVDHTTLTNRGSFAYIQFDGASSDSEGSIIGKEHLNNNRECIHFWYVIDGAGSVDLKVTERCRKTGSTSEFKLLTKTVQANDNHWRFGQLPIYNIYFNWRVVFNVVKNTGFTGYFGIDDISIDFGACRPAINCNFEDYSLCSWSQSRVDDFDWSLNSGSTDTTSTGPHVDHTLGTDLGVYIYVESSYPAQKGEKAILTSEYLEKTTAPACFSLWYFMHGSQVGEMNVYMNSTSVGNRLLAAILGEQGQVWKKLEITVENAEEFRLNIEGVVGDGYNGDIAVDDVEYALNTDCTQATTLQPTTTTTEATYPISALDCNFDSMTTCNWINDTTGDFQWSLNQAGTSSWGTGPSVDHTTNSRNGHYIFIEASYPQKFNDTARLLSRYVTINPGVAGACFKFYYHMFGSDIYKLHVKMQERTSGNEQLLWQKQGNKGDQWLFGSVYVERDSTRELLLKESRFVLEGIVGNGYEGDIAVDDVSFNEGACPLTNVCDFEQADLCGYANEENADFLWNRVQGLASEPDHSYGTSGGHYMVAKAVPSWTSKLARLYSPEYPGTTICASFWYKVKGAVTFNVRKFDFSLSSVAAYTVKSDRGQNWLLAHVTMSSDTAFRIVYEVEDKGFTSGSGGQVYLDDIEISYEACAPLGTCDFESGSCGFSNVGDFDWVIQTGQFGLDQTSSEAPTDDHTIGSAAGHYMYLDTLYNYNQKKAVLESGVVGENMGTMCVGYWVKTNQNNQAKLNLNVRNVKTDAVTNVYGGGLDSSVGWKLIEVQLNNSAFPFAFQLEGVTGAGYVRKGMLAFDDVNLYAGDCKGAVVPPGQFDCGNGEFIDGAKVCDFVRDCQNGADEKNCGTCDFEANEQCGWYDDSTGVYSWKRVNNGTITADIGPNSDHTLGNATGHYMSLMTINSTAFGSTTGRLNSPKLARAHSTCRLKFWYTKTVSGGSFYVAIYSNGKEVAKIYRQVYSKTSADWSEVDVQLGSVYNEFQIVFLASKPYTRKGPITIDDVSFQNCALPAITAGTCGKDELSCRRGNCVNDEFKCDFVDDCGDFTDETLPQCASYDKCTFEYGLCDWYNEPGQSSLINWKQQSGPTITADTGPDRDHTSGLASGKYIFIDAYYAVSQVFGDIGNKSRLYSKIYYKKSASEDCTFLMYYHMFGADMGQLNVYIRYFSDDNVFNKIFDVSGNQGLNWQRSLLKLVPPASFEPVPFQIIVEGVIGQGQLSDIALDDTAFSPGCAPYPTGLPSQQTTTVKTSTVSTPKPTPIIPTTKPVTQAPVTRPKTTPEPVVCYTGYCQNQGSCNVNTQTNSLQCFCKSGWFGDQCELQRNKSPIGDVNNSALLIGVGVTALAIVIGLLGLVRFLNMRTAPMTLNIQSSSPQTSRRQEDMNVKLSAVSNPAFEINDIE